MISQASHSQDRFATTRWSMVQQFADGKSAIACDALGELARRYQYPIYTYVRRLGRTPGAAALLTQELLRRLHDDAPSARPGGDYRRFLLDRLAALMDAGVIASAEPVAINEPAHAAELEQRYLRDHDSGGSAEQAFQRSFALVVLQRSLDRLREEAESTGHGDMFRALEPYLARDPPVAQFEGISQQLRLRHVTLVLALKRLRQRLRELAAEELADTVRTADDLSREQEALLVALAEQSR
jgi:RNA polymerase sigma-70 factor (ECF subfamily)